MHAFLCSYEWRGAAMLFLRTDGDPKSVGSSLEKIDAYVYNQSELACVVKNNYLLFPLRYKNGLSDT